MMVFDCEWLRLLALELPFLTEAPFVLPMQNRTQSSSMNRALCPWCSPFLGLVSACRW